jgi:catechol 2,3-dioxygenase-like lactoylglutathione lyase family enzyme
MNEVYAISAVTLIIRDMKRSCDFYSKVPGFELIYGGSGNDAFTTYQIGRHTSPMYLNLELEASKSKSRFGNYEPRFFGRIIFYTTDVDKLYYYFISDTSLSSLILLVHKPVDAPWGERYFHVREPDGYELSFAHPLKKKSIQQNKHNL